MTICNTIPTHPETGTCRTLHHLLSSERKNCREKKSFGFSLSWSADEKKALKPFSADLLMLLSETCSQYLRQNYSEYPSVPAVPHSGILLARDASIFSYSFQIRFLDIRPGNSFLAHSANFWPLSIIYFFLRRVSRHPEQIPPEILIFPASTLILPVLSSQGNGHYSKDCLT